MTAMEAYMRLYSQKVVNMSHKVFSLSVHTEDGQNIVIEEGSEFEGMHRLNQNTRLTGFFELCRGADPLPKSLTYNRLPYYFW